LRAVGDQPKWMESCIVDCFAVCQDRQ
jgi:hypothetical protein